MNIREDELEEAHEEEYDLRYDDYQIENDSSPESLQ